MTAPRLEAPDTVDELYLARGEEIPQWRPITTGDVFDDVPLTLAPEGTGSAIVLTHPCSMRVDGVRLADRLLVAPVLPSAEFALGDWKGHYRKMPLPELRDGASYAADFTKIEPVASASLAPAARIAALQPVGVNLLLQRLVHHMSRVVVETGLFDVACGPAFAEVELIENWLEAAVDAGHDPAEAARVCHDWLRGGDGGGPTSPQGRLGEPQQRPAVRREAKLAVKAWLHELSQ